VRFVALALIAALVVVLGSLQAVASLALRESAVPGSWVRLVPPGIATRVERLAPAFPLTPALRLLLAQRALERQDTAAAARQIAELSPSRDRAALAGRLAEERGEPAAAERAYLDAGDLEGLERLVARAEDSGDLTGALALQRAAVRRLFGDRTQTDALAEALYRLGVLEEAVAARMPAGKSRRAGELRSLDAYDRAVALAPFTQRYLIAAGSQELNLGDLGAAGSDFVRARETDPTSAVAFVGLGEVAFRRGDLAEARALLRRARALDPASASAGRLARKLGE
jgi:tetratricopeptide (TPR) repeat protein